MMKKTLIRPLMAMLLMLMVSTAWANPVKKVLVIGDSMTGWLGDRLGAYGELNGFDVATVIWDGATIDKYGSSPRLSQIIREKNPDLVVVSLGMNNLFEPNPEKKLTKPVESILGVIGNRHLVWVGPPSWPGKDMGPKVDNWLAAKLGPNRYFRTFGLSIPRQSKTNPHPTQAGSASIVDEMVKWMRTNPALNSHINLSKSPAAGKMARSKDFTYRRMKQTL